MCTAYYCEMTMKPKTEALDDDHADTRFADDPLASDSASGPLDPSEIMRGR